MISLLSCLVFISFIKGSRGGECEQGWLYSPHTKYCYYPVSTPTTFNNAEFACLMKKANLVSVHNGAENRFVSEIAAKFGKPIWLGGAIFGGSSRQYEYIDATPFDYTNWENGTQPEYNKGRKCVKINPENQKWFDDCCYRRPVPYVCKKSMRKNDPYWHTVVEAPTSIKNGTNNTQVALKLSNSKLTAGSTVTQRRETKDNVNDTVVGMLIKGFERKNNSKIIGKTIDNLGFKFKVMLS